MVSDDCPAGPRFGCWNVAATEIALQARGSRSNQRTEVLVSRTAVTHWSSSRQAASASARTGSVGSTGVQRQIAPQIHATDAGDRFHGPQRRIEVLRRVSASAPRPPAFRAWGRRGPDAAVSRLSSSPSAVTRQLAHRSAQAVTSPSTMRTGSSAGWPGFAGSAGDVEQDQRPTPRPAVAAAWVG